MNIPKINLKESELCSYFIDLIQKNHCKSLIQIGRLHNDSILEL